MISDDYEKFVKTLIKIEYGSDKFDDEELEKIYKRYMKSEENLLGISNIVDILDFID